MHEPHRSRSGAAGQAALERGRDLHRRRAWAQAYEALTVADRAELLEPGDLERLALCAYMLGHDDEYAAVLDRAHHTHHAAGDRGAAVRCAFWLGLHLSFSGQPARASGWFARAERLLDDEPSDRVERGYLRVAAADRALDAGSLDAAFAAASDAVRIGERHADADLIACARHLQGIARLLQGRIADGLGLLDDAMLSVTRGELSPLVTGLLYCSVIEGCRRVSALERAAEWTSALARWCEAQPQMIAFTGKCLVHRAEVFALRGDWDDALEEAKRADARLRSSSRPSAAAAALYQQGEVLRLRGALTEAEAAYRAASQWGWEPQPGLALLRLAQGRAGDAAASIRRTLAAATAPDERARLLPACIEIHLALGDIDEAGRACCDLEKLAALLGGRYLALVVAMNRGATSLAAGDAEAACRSLREARELAVELEVPHLMARARELLGLACRALGDEDGAALELGAARDVFERLGAASDIARIHSSSKTTDHGSQKLTARELEVLRLVASGASNKSIAHELSLREKTVERHLSNIFNKLGVHSRTAAAAYAYEHGLVR